MLINNYDFGLIPGMGDYPTPEDPEEEYTTEDYRESVSEQINWYYKEIARMKAECEKLTYAYGWESVPFDTYEYVLEGLHYTLSELDQPCNEEVEAVQEQAEYAINRLRSRVARYQGKREAV